MPIHLALKSTRFERESSRSDFGKRDGSWSFENMSGLARAIQGNKIGPRIEVDMDNIELEMMSSFAHLLACHAEVGSGAYKQRKLKVPEDSNREMSDKEKLAHSIKEIDSHAQRISELAEKAKARNRLNNKARSP